MEMYEAFKTIDELIENSHRIVKHVSLINTPNTSTNYFVGKSQSNKLMIYVL